MQQYQISYIDQDGKRATHSTWIGNSYVLGDTDMDALMVAIRAVTAARVEKHGIRAREVVSGDTVTSNPYDVADKLILKARTVAGAFLNVVIPAPLQLVLSGDDVVNLAAPAIVALADALVARCGLPGGDLIQEIIGGYRSRKNRIRYAS